MSGPTAVVTVATVHACRAMSGVATFGARLAGLPAGGFTAYPVLLSGRAHGADAFADVPGAVTLACRNDAPAHERILALRDAITGAHVVIPNDSAEGFIAAAMLHHRGVRTLLWHHSSGPDGDDVLRRCAALADAWAAVSTPLRAHVQGLWTEMGAEMGVVLPPPAHNEALPVCVGVRSDAPVGPPVVRTLRLLYAGRLEKAHKRVMDLVALADALTARSARFFLTIVGDGPAREQLGKALSDRGHSGRVMFTGALPPHILHEMYGAHDFTVLVSASEGWPLAVAESLAGGRPVAITTGCGGAPELVRREACGVVVPTGDMDAMAKALSPYAEDRERLAALNEAALRAARGALCPGVLTARYEEAIGATARMPARFDLAAGLGEDVRRHWLRILDAMQAVRGADSGTARVLRDAWLADIAQMGCAMAGRGEELPLESEPVPTEGALRLAKAAQALRAGGAQRIALFGAGAHTRGLARWLDRCGPFAAVIDDLAGGPGAPDILAGLPVVSPSRLGTMRIDAVIVSSDEHEADMIEAAAGWRWRGPVVALYDPTLSLGARSSVSA
jgi:glycosyltransferase involved in cell wall biosynthesis